MFSGGQISGGQVTPKIESTPVTTPTPGGEGGAKAPAPSSGGGLSWSAASGISSAVGAGCQAISAICSYVFGKQIIKSQKAMAENQIHHGEKMAELDRDAQLGQVQKQEENLKMASAMSAESLKVKEELKSAECEGKIIDAKIKESSLTKKAGEIDRKKLNKMFDTRGNYSLGKPKSPSHLIEKAKHL